MTRCDKHRWKQKENYSSPSHYHWNWTEVHLCFRIKHPMVILAAWTMWVGGSGSRKNGDFNLEWGAWAFPPPAYSPSQPPQRFPSEVSSTWSGRKFILSILILGIEPQYPHSPLPDLGPVCVQGSEVESLPRTALLPLPSFLHFLSLPTYSCVLFVFPRPLGAPENLLTQQGKKFRRQSFG